MLPNRSHERKLIVVVGSTASGKSDLAIRLAKKYNGEVISADSRQIYRGMNIGTGKVKRDGFTIHDSRFKKKNSYISQGVAHHLIDVASPKRQFTVTQYQNLAQRAVEDIWRHGKILIICGGTGQYVDALVYGQQFPKVKPDFTLRKKLGKKTVVELYAMLKQRDPRRAKTIDPHNPRRIVRALEILLATGNPIPALDLRFKMQDSRILWIGLNPPKEKLHRNIHKRLLARIQQGMIAEVKRLKKQGVSSRRLESLGLEYRYINRYLELSSRTCLALPKLNAKEGSGIHPTHIRSWATRHFVETRQSPAEYSTGAFRPFQRGGIREAKKQMLAQLERAIRHYAKRQMTWFKRNKEVHWVQNTKEVGKLIRKFLHS